ncbi:MAG: hypothetical protein HY360_22520 [Verrucomicrobia bacterium]|nr:hypothetical protein [Verrucomicrobiota bacterium]
MRVLFLFVMLAATRQATAADKTAGVLVSENKDANGQLVVTLENEFLKIAVMPERGGRIARLTDKRSGIQPVYWEGHKKTGLGGLLDDHGNCTEGAYQHTIERSDQAVKLTLKLDERPMAFQKTYVLQAGSPALTVMYTIANHGQDAVSQMNRNMFVPGGGSVTKDDAYFIPISFLGVTRSEYKVQVPAGAYDGGLLSALGGSWSAFLDQKRATGFAWAMRTDFMRGWYFWLDSETYPTFEWFSKPLEPGQVHRYTVDLIAVDGFRGLVDANRRYLLDAQPSCRDGQLTVPWKFMPLAKEAVIAQLRYVVEEAASHAELAAGQAPLTDLALNQAKEGTLILPVKTAKNLILRLALALPGGFKQAVALPITQEPQPSPFKAECAHEEPRDCQPIPGWKWVSELPTPNPTAEEKIRKFLLYDKVKDGAAVRCATLELDVGVNEFESFPVMVYPLEDVGVITVDRSTPGRIPLRIRVEETETAEEKTWKSRITRRKLLETSSFSSAKDQPRSVWLTLDARNLSPGDYQESVQFVAEKGGQATFLLKVRVAPVRLPGARFFTGEAEHLINSMAGMQQAGDKIWKLDPTRVYLRDLVEHNVTVAQISAAWRFGGGLHPTFSEVLIRATGEPLLAAIQKDPARFRSGPLPRLDFTFWNPILTLPIEEGMTRLLKMASYVPGYFSDYLALSQMIHGPAIKPETEEHARIRQWMWQEVGRYLGEIGYPVRVAKIDDETPKDKYPLWNRAGAELRRLGWRTTVPTSEETIQSADATRLINPHLDLWTIGTLNPRSLAARLTAGDIDTADELWTYTGSGTISRTYAGMRAECGLIAPYAGMSGMHIHEYYRWSQDACIIYPSAKGPIGSPAWEGVRDGLDDARYYAYAKWLIARLDPSKAPPFAKRLAQVIGEDADCLLRVRYRKADVGEVIGMPNAGDVDLQRTAKRTLLQLIGELEKIVPAPVSCHYGFLDLSKDWEFVAGAGVAPEVVRNLQQELSRKLGRAVQVKNETAAPDNARKRGNVALFGGPAESEWMKTLNAQLKDPVYLERWPVPGWHVIRELTPEETGGGRILAVGGHDAAGTRKACDFFVKVMD